MDMITTGFYVEQGEENQKFIIEWTRLPALSEEFADKMISIASIGIDSFKQVEIDFLSAYPQAMEEDKTLSVFSELKGCDVETAMSAKLSKIFHLRPKDLSDELRVFMTEVYYYFVTIKEENSETVQGFITFMAGGALPEYEYKITILAVDKNVRRRGLASFLIKSLDKIGVEYKKISVSTRPTNAGAIKAYEKWGFVEDQEIFKNRPPHFLNGHWIHLTRCV
ncbi:hypothetical protein PHSC3_001677 [Chlamydiales bacterium STE3]|nr:hypothetical protein PHSC3_001677 [Chlamydiales bacterium STE3]